MAGEQHTSGQPPQDSLSGLRLGAQRFLDWNRRLSWRLAGLAIFRPLVEADSFRDYRERVIANHNGGVTLDIGGGADPLVVGRPTLVMDTSFEELRRCAVSGRFVAQAENLPMKDNSVEGSYSRAVLEHVENTERALRESARVSSSFGVHVFSGSRAPYSLLNRLLPQETKRRLLYALNPASRDGEGGFPAHYDSCTYSALDEIMSSMNVQYSITCYYYQAHYYAFFFPLFLTMLLWDLVVDCLGLRDIAAYYLIEFRAHS